MIQRILHSRHVLACHGNGALLPDAIPGRQYLLRVMAIRSAPAFLFSKYSYTPLPRYNALHRLFDPAFRHLHFRPQGRPQDSGRQIASLFRPSEKNRTSLVVGEVHHARKLRPSETPRWLVIPERGLFAGIAIVGAVGSGKTASCMYAFAEQIKCRAAEGSATGAATPPLASRAEGKLAS